jgi:hypothetical protein
MGLDIVNCNWKFEFQCPRQWSSLRETGDAKVRMCEACLREVHWCENDEEVRVLAARGACVAVARGGTWEEGLLGEVVLGD